MALFHHYYYNTLSQSCNSVTQQARMFVSLLHTLILSVIMDLYVQTQTFHFIALQLIIHVNIKANMQVLYRVRLDTFIKGAQTIVMSFTVTHQNALCVSFNLNKHVQCVFLIKYLRSRFFKHFQPFVIYIHIY